MGEECDEPARDGCVREGGPVHGTVRLDRDARAGDPGREHVVGHVLEGVHDAVERGRQDEAGRGDDSDDVLVRRRHAASRLVVNLAHPRPRRPSAPGERRTGPRTGDTRAVSAAPTTPGSFYDEVGGHETFVRLVDVFYEGVATDEVLRPLYPEEELGPARQRLTMFLEQYWGGPTTYSETRGHPRLRMRHAPFKVNPDARDRWLAHMRGAVDALDLSPLHEATLWDYLERAAHSLVNTFEE
ncbi:hypothetical protein GCM10025864_43380 [Luteimicrobium album]|uniref:Globin n=1 Tax=Luteimicrobium album TaxID=1054550 RepID=A0ABQ6I994_9MICO|nr:hypothetical protein GCM10025864_43380 [Luteimicrobium album]